MRTKEYDVNLVETASDQREREPHNARGSANPDATPARCRRRKKFVVERPAPLPFIETTDCSPFYFRETVKTSDGRILEERKSYFFGLFRSEKK